MNILITGINGFIGSNFTNSWKDAYTLYGLDINRTHKDGVRMIFNWEDLDNTPQIDSIVHLAGLAEDTSEDNEETKQKYREINVGLTKRAFDHFLNRESKTFIFFSTIKAAADKVEGIMTEEMEPRPKGVYGESKREAEEYILSKEQECIEKGKRFYILRPAMIYGGTLKGNMKTLYSFVSKGLPWPFGAFENKRSFCSINNMRFVLDRLLTDSTVPSGIYNVCDDGSLSTNELVTVIAHGLGRKPKVWKTRKGLFRLAAKLGDLIHTPFNTHTLDKLTEDSVVENSKLKKALGIHRMPYETRDEVIKLVRNARND